MQAAIFGFNLACWATGCFGSPGGQKSLSDMAATGASWVAVVQTAMVDSPRASRFNGATVNDDADLRAEIRRAKALGLKVALKPHVDAADGAFRASIDPADLDAWWKDYETYILAYAKMAAEEKADLYVVGTELAKVASPARASRWKGLIARVRAIYHGPLTYASNWYDYPFIPFWKELDFIGVDGYFPIPTGERRAALEAGWEVWKAPLAAQAMAAGKPVLFTEFGCSSQKGANMKPWEWNRLGPVDLELQKNYYETFLESFGREPWFAGVLVWGWDIEPSSGGPDSFGLTVQHKPALAVLERIFARWRGTPTGFTRTEREELDRRARRALVETGLAR